MKLLTFTKRGSGGASDQILRPDPHLSPDSFPLSWEESGCLQLSQAFFNELHINQTEADKKGDINKIHIFIYITDDDEAVSSHPHRAGRSWLSRMAVTVNSGRMASRFVSRPQWAVSRSGVTMTTGSTAEGSPCRESGDVTESLESVSLWPARYKKHQDENCLKPELKV